MRSFNPDKGWGFLACDECSVDIFLHAQELRAIVSAAQAEQAALENECERMLGGARAALAAREAELVEKVRSPSEPKV